jgi:hypothetical protein
MVNSGVRGKEDRDLRTEVRGGLHAGRAYYLPGHVQAPSAGDL